MIVKDITFTNTDGKEIQMEMALNMSSLRFIEKELKKIDSKYNFYNCLKYLEKGQELTIVSVYFLGCLHKPNDFRCVDPDFFDKNKIDFLKYATELFQNVLEIIVEDMQPTKKSDQVGKQETAN